MIIEKVWGYEKIIVNDKARNLCLKEMVIYPNFHSSIHYHKEKDEYFYIINGRMKLELFYEGAVIEDRYMSQGDMYFIKSGRHHMFSNSSGQVCKFMECSTYHDDNDVVRIKPSGEIV